MQCPILSSASLTHGKLVWLMPTESYARHVNSAYRIAPSSQLGSPLDQVEDGADTRVVLIVAVGQDAAHVLAGIEREELEVRIAEVSENIRTLVEEATAVNGASDDDSIQAGIPTFRARLSLNVASPRSQALRGLPSAGARGSSWSATARLLPPGGDLSMSTYRSACPLALSSKRPILLVWTCCAPTDH